MEVGELHDHPAALLAVAEVASRSLNGPSSYRLATSLEQLIWQGADAFDDALAEELAAEARRVGGDRIDHWNSVLATCDARLVSVMDDDYPANLRMVQDRPPFLFVRGDLLPRDSRAFAVVGTRKPSPVGIDAAARIAQALVDREVTVVSGLAEGIDTVAHRTAIEAGGRSIAVLGSGLNRVYPATNQGLSEAIQRAGAVVSQFWPEMAPTRWSFPARNIVTSGLSLGTIVVEAGATSGARIQAESAIGHGKWVFLLPALVEQQEWAAEMLDRPGVRVLEEMAEIDRVLDMSLDLSAAL